MKLLSSAFESGETIPSRYTCEGEDLSPPLFFQDVPKGAASLVLLMDDPDVPPSIRPDRMWDHWVVYNIPPHLKGIPEGGPVPGTTGRNTAGRSSYMGPCPPDREHRYFFRLYALDCRLSLAAGATKREVLAAMEGHLLIQAELMGRYEKMGVKKRR